MAPSTQDVWAALALGSVSSVGLLVGAVAGTFSRLRHERIAMTMSVGAGLLLAGVSLKLARDAMRVAGPVAAALSLLVGAAAFSSGNALLSRFGATHRKRCASVFSSLRSRSSLVAESQLDSATRLMRLPRRWCWESP